MAIAVLNSIKNIQDEYCLSNKLPVFATQEYSDYLLEVKGIKTIWFINEIEKQIIFILPLGIKRIYVFNKGCFLTAVNNIGSKPIDKEKEFLEDVIKIIRENNLCDWIEQPSNWALFNVVPSKSIYCEFGTYRTELENNNEIELYSKLKHEVKRMLKKAFNSNLIVKCGPELVDDCSKVFFAAAINGNTTLPSKYEIIKLIEKMPNNIKIYAAYDNDVPQVCVIFFFTQYSIYAVYSGMIPYSDPGANHLLDWQVMKDAAQMGIKYFDFVGARIKPLPGSKQEGIQRYKKHFGGDFVKGYLWKLPISNSKYLLYKSLIRTEYFAKNKKYMGDIIDQELNNNKIKEILLTVDYELYLGEKTGTVRECMIDPTNRVATLLKINNSKMTVFWDILHYYRMLQLESIYPELKEDRLLIEKQVLDLVKSGHDIQLHIHPHWLDAQYENHKWVFQYDRFKLHKLKKDRITDDINTILGCISISKAIIEKLIRGVSQGYKIMAFRAGGYLIEPFEEISEALIFNEIMIDSSVCSELFKKNGISSYDFRLYPHNQKYKFTLSPRTIEKEGKFWEIPITTIQMSKIRIIYYKLLKKIKYPSLEKGRKGIGFVDNHTGEKINILSKILSILNSTQRDQFTTDSNFPEKFNYMYKKVPENSTMILHSKLLNDHTFGILQSYLSNNKIHFNSLKNIFP